MPQRSPREIELMRRHAAEHFGEEGWWHHSSNWGSDGNGNTQVFDVFEHPVWIPIRQLFYLNGQFFRSCTCPDPSIARSP